MPVNGSLACNHVAAASCGRLQPTTTGMAHNEIDVALQRFTAPQSDPVALLRGLMDAIRPADRRDGPTATANWRALNSALAGNETYRQAVGAKFLELLATRRLMSFFAEEGILPATGFLAELNRKIIHKILPELQDEKVFKDCLVLVFHRRKDYLWFNAIPIEDKLTFWRSLDWKQSANGAQVGVVYEQLLEALLIVSHSTLALAFHPELRRVCPEVEERPSPFLALHQEVSRFVDQCRARFTRQELGVRSQQAEGDKQDAGTHDQEPAPSTLKPDHCSPTPVHAFTGAQAKAAGIPKALILCRLQLSHALAATLERGVRLSLTYLLTRLEQHLDR